MITFPEFEVIATQGKVTLSPAEGQSTNHYKWTGGKWLHYSHPLGRDWSRRPLQFLCGSHFSYLFFPVAVINLYLGRFPPFSFWPRFPGNPTLGTTVESWPRGEEDLPLASLFPLVLLRCFITDLQIFLQTEVLLFVETFSISCPCVTWKALLPTAWHGPSALL